MKLYPSSLKFSALALTAALASPVSAFDINNMNEDERAEFGAQVRAYLLENPQVLNEVIAVLQSRQAEQEAMQDVSLVKANLDALTDDGYSYVTGSPDASVTVVEFIDYRCGYCRKAHSEVKALLGSDDDLRYIVKEFPILGEQSVDAARFAISALNVAGPEAYAAINAGFYESFRGDVTPDTLAAFARSLDLDPAPILAGMDADEVTEVIEQNHLLAQRLGISGTPAFVIGGQMLRGYAPLDHLKDLVRDERG